MDNNDKGIFLGGYFEKDYAIIKEFRSNHGCSNNELKKDMLFLLSLRPESLE
jgi:hypothetical protein